MMAPALSGLIGGVPDIELVEIAGPLPAPPDPAAASWITEVVTATLAMYPAGIVPRPWCGYLARGQDGSFLGTCAFKGSPCADSVEIAYFTFPGHESRGVATAMASLLIEIARGHGAKLVRAQTSPTPGASTRVLEKLGFKWHGVAMHPEDGAVWEWRMVVAAQA